MNNFGEIIKKYGLFAFVIALFLYYVFEKTQLLEETWKRYSFIGVIGIFFVFVIIGIYLERIAFGIKEKEDNKLNTQKIFHDSFQIMLNNHIEFQAKIEHFFETLLESQMEMQKSVEIVKQRIIELDRDFNMNMDRIYTKLYDTISKETFNELFLLYVDRIFLRVTEKFIETMKVLENCKENKECINNIIQLFKHDIKGIIKEMAKSFFVKYKFEIDKKYYAEMKDILFGFADNFGDGLSFNSCISFSNWKNCFLESFLEYAKREIREEIILKISMGGENGK